MAYTLLENSCNHSVLRAASVAATGTNTSDVFSVGAFTQGTLQYVWASITGAATCEMQSSNDNSNWDSIAGSSITTSGAAGSSSISISPLPGAFMRMKVTSTAGAGTVTPTLCAKNGR